MTDPNQLFATPSIWARPPEERLTRMEEVYRFMLKRLEIEDSMRPLSIFVVGASTGGGVLALSRLLPQAIFYTTDPVHPLHETVNSELGGRVKESWTELFPQLMDSKNLFRVWDIIIIENIPGSTVVLDKHFMEIFQALREGGCFVYIGSESGMSNMAKRNSRKYLLPILVYQGPGTVLVGDDTYAPPPEKVVQIYRRRDSITEETET